MKKKETRISYLARLPSWIVTSDSHLRLMIYLFKSLSKRVVLSKPKIGYVIKKTPGIVELLSRPPERDAINKLKSD